MRSLLALRALLEPPLHLRECRQLLDSECEALFLRLLRRGIGGGGSRGVGLAPSVMVVRRMEEGREMRLGAGEGMVWV